MSSRAKSRHWTLTGQPAHTARARAMMAALAPLPMVYVATSSGRQGDFLLKYVAFFKLGERRLRTHCHTAMHK